MSVLLHNVQLENFGHQHFSYVETWLLWGSVGGEALQMIGTRETLLTEEAKEPVESPGGVEVNQGRAHPSKTNSLQPLVFLRQFVLTASLLHFER